MTKIGETFIVSSSFSYHFVLKMQNKTGVEVPIGRQICMGNHDRGFANTTLDNRCIRDIRAELQIYAENIYYEINNNIDQITNMLPREINILPRGRGKKRGLFDGLGNLLAYVTGIATENELTKLEQRLQILKSFVSDNQDVSRTQLGYPLVAKRLLARRVHVILDDVNKNAHEVNMHMELLIARTAEVEREINYVPTYILKFMR